MREQVTIVLNEREPPKARAAEALQAALRDSGITASRLPVTEAIEEIVVERRPLVAVLDYLLGDFSTGLDILARIKALKEEERPAVFFLTDEPSVPVAVEAMRLGALDYFALDHPQSVQKLTRAIEGAIRSVQPSRSGHSAASSELEPASVDDLVAQAKTSSAALKQLQVLAEEHVPVLILRGEHGAGKRTWAKVYQSLRAETSPHKLVDLRTCVDSLADITGHSPRRVGPRLGIDLCLTILHAEEDDGELLEYVARQASSWWGEGAESYLVVCTASEQNAKAWERLLPNARAISLPNIADRTEDIAGFVQRFTNDASSISGERLKPFDAATLRWMSGLAWPGNVRQLRAVTIESALRAAREKSNNPKELIEQQRALWEAENLEAPPADPDSQLTLAQILELYGHRYRAAAAMLGCSTRALLSKLDATKRGAS